MGQVGSLWLGWRGFDSALTVLCLPPSLTVCPREQMGKGEYYKLGAFCHGGGGDE